MCNIVEGWYLSVAEFLRADSTTYVYGTSFVLKVKLGKTSAVVYGKVEKLAVKVNRAEEKKSSTVEIIRPKTLLQYEH